MLKAYAMALAVSTTAPVADNTKENVDAAKANNNSSKTVLVDTTTSKHESKKKKWMASKLLSR